MEEPLPEVPTVQVQDDELLAVLTAAVAAAMESEGEFNTFRHPFLQKGRADLGHGTVPDGIRRSRTGNQIYFGGNKHAQIYY